MINKICNRKWVQCACRHRGVLSMLKNDKGTGNQTFNIIVQEFIRSYTLYRINQRWNDIEYSI